MIINGVVKWHMDKPCADLGMGNTKNKTVKICLGFQSNLPLKGFLGASTQFSRASVAQNPLLQTSLHTEGIDIAGENLIKY